MEHKTLDFIKLGYLGKSDWWRYLIGFIIVFIVWQLLGAIPLLVVAYQQASSFEDFMYNANIGFTNLFEDKNYLLALMLITGVFGVMALFLVVKKLHKRAFKTILTARKHFDWKRFSVGFVITFSIALVSLYLAVQEGSDELVWHFKPETFYPLLIISLVLFPFQTGIEEFVFRGYLMQWVGTGFNSRLAALLTTGILFGVVHGANPEVAKLGDAVMIFYIGTGLFYGITTLMDEGLELSFGMHTANNIAAALLISTDWTMITTDALYIDYSEPQMSAEMLIPVLVGYPILIYIYGKMYKWTNWKEKLTGKVYPDDEQLNEIGS